MGLFSNVPSAAAEAACKRVLVQIEQTHNNDRLVYKDVIQRLFPADGSGSPPAIIAALGKNAAGVFKWLDETRQHLDHLAEISGDTTHLAPDWKPAGFTFRIESNGTVTAIHEAAEAPVTLLQVETDPHAKVTPLSEDVGKVLPL